MATTHKTANAFAVEDMNFAQELKNDYWSMNMLTEFQKRVVGKIKKIPKGKVTTYGLLAKAIGKPKAWRAVGNAVGRNPYAPIVPCHRVVKSDGGVGGYSKGVRKKVSLLKKEGVAAKSGKIADFEKKIHSF